MLHRYSDGDEAASSVHARHSIAPSQREIELHERANRMRGDSRAPPPPTTDIAISPSVSSSSSSGPVSDGSVDVEPNAVSISFP
jgi:hypothetical protein